MADTAFVHGSGIALAFSLQSTPSMSKINCKTESRIIIEHPIGLLNPVAALLIQRSSFSKCDLKVYYKVIFSKKLS